LEQIKANLNIKIIKLFKLNNLIERRFSIVREKVKFELQIFIILENIIFDQKWLLSNLPDEFFPIKNLDIFQKLNLISIQIKTIHNIPILFLLNRDFPIQLKPRNFKTHFFSQKFKNLVCKPINF
jgi:hypothetical protein